MLTLLLLLFCPMALAQDDMGGLVVRLVVEEAIDEEVKVVLTDAANTTSEALLKDDGQPPDVVAGDLHYSGSALVMGNAFTVELMVGDAVTPAGDIEYAADQPEGRNLLLTRTAGILSTEATVTPVTGGDDPGGSPATPGGTPSPADPPSGDVPLTFPGGAGGADADVASGGGSSLYLLLGLGLVALAGVGALWLRGGGRERPALEGGVAPLPEASLLGHGTPSLSDGLSIWRVAEADLAGFAGAMLQHLATHHRVLVVAPATVELTPVHGGPVYRSPSLSPSKVADFCDDLDDARGAPLALLVLTDAPDLEALEDYADLLAPDMGVVVVSSQDVAMEAPTLAVAAAGAGWTVDGVSYQATRTGLVTPA